MSKHVVSLVYSRRVGKSQSPEFKASASMRKSVLAYMADVANHDGTGVWSSKQRIADEIEASRRGVIDTIHSLTDQGILKVVGKRKNANGYTIEYALDLATITALPELKHKGADPCISAPVQKRTRAPRSPVQICTSAESAPQDVNQVHTNRPGTNAKDAGASLGELSKTKKPKPQPRGSARGRRISENWAPSPVDIAFAQKKGLAPEEIRHEADRFRDHFLSKTGRDAAKKDWAATWRNWITSPYGPLSGRQGTNGRRRQSLHSSGRLDQSAVDEAFSDLRDAPLAGVDGRGREELYRESLFAERGCDPAAGEGLIIDAECVDVTRRSATG